MVPQISSLPAEAWPSPFDVAVLLAVALRPSSWLVMASPELRSSPVPATMVSSPALAVAESPASAALVDVAVPPEPDARASPATMSSPEPVMLRSLPAVAVAAHRIRNHCGYAQEWDVRVDIWGTR